MSTQSNPPVTIPDALKAIWNPIRQLDGGHQAVILECVNKSNEHVVLKILSDKPTEYQLNRMAREIHVLNEINHQNVIKPIEWDKSDAPKWYLMSAGIPLKVYWKSYLAKHIGDPMALFEESTRIICGLLSGLNQLHERSYVHRDVKPHNVVISKTGEPMMIDLGIVHHPKFDPITPSNGAGNRFVIISSRINASPYVDCLCIASLWAYLLARDASISFGHFHWKYIDLIGDDWRYEIVRAVLANCSHEVSGPQNAGQMLQALLIQYNLDKLTEKAEVVEADIEAALIAQSAAIAKATIDNADYRDKVEAAAMAASKSLETLKDGLRDFIISLQEKRLKVSFRDLVGDINFTQYLLQLLKIEPGTKQGLLIITGGINSTHYCAELTVQFKVQNSETDELGFIIHWKLDAKKSIIGTQSSSSSSMEQSFALTKQLVFKTIYNAELPEYDVTQLISLFQNHLLSQARYLA